MTLVFLRAIAAIAFFIISFVNSLPTGVDPPPPSSISMEPGTLLGRRYLTHPRGDSITRSAGGPDKGPLHHSARHTNPPRRAAPLPKYLAERAEAASWEGATGVNYLSNVGVPPPAEPIPSPTPPAPPVFVTAPGPASPLVNHADPSTSPDSNTLATHIPSPTEASHAKHKGKKAVVKHAKGHKMGELGRKD